MPAPTDFQEQKDDDLRWYVRFGNEWKEARPYQIEAVKQYKFSKLPIQIVREYDNRFVFTFIVDLLVSKDGFIYTIYKKQDGTTVKMIHAPSNSIKDNKEPDDALTWYVRHENRWMAARWYQIKAVEQYKRSGNPYQEVEGDNYKFTFSPLEEKGHGSIYTGYTTEYGKNVEMFYATPGHVAYINRVVDYGGGKRKSRKSHKSRKSRKSRSRMNKKNMKRRTRK